MADCKTIGGMFLCRREESSEVVNPYLEGVENVVNRCILPQAPVETAQWTSIQITTRESEARPSTGLASKSPFMATYFHVPPLAHGFEIDGQRAAYTHQRTVRMFKAARNRLVEKKVLTKDDAPSCSIECLLYNIPNTFSVTNLVPTYIGVLDTLRSAKPNDFECHNGQVALFGTGAVVRSEVAGVRQWLAGTLGERGLRNEPETGQVTPN